MEFEKEQTAAAEQQFNVEMARADTTQAKVHSKEQPIFQATQDEVRQWKDALQTEKDKVRQVWKRNCQQLAEAPVYIKMDAQDQLLLSEGECW